MPKRLVRLIFIPLFALFAGLFLACEPQQKPLYAAPDDLDDVREATACIVHAGGELWGVDSEGNLRAFLGSNSLEGLEQCAENGCRTVELDFNFTSDGELACIHDWYPEYIDGIAFGIPLSEAEFRQSKIFWNYTPICITDVADFLRAHPDMYLVTDVKDRFEDAVARIAEACPDLKDRFLIQIYAEEQYAFARAAGFDHVIFTLYLLDWEEKTDWQSLGNFAASHPLTGFTFSYELCGVPGFVDGMQKSGVPLYVHTVNGAENRQIYYDMGVTGVYTDDVR